MQSVKYHKEGLYQYMVLETEKEMESTYSNDLFQHQDVPNFLRYELRTVDDRQRIYYRLQYKNSLQSVREFLSFKETMVRGIMESIICVLETAKDYLLDMNHIIWSMECIFMEIETGRLLFCYYPGSSPKYSLQEFLTEFIQIVGKKNEKNVVMMLQFYNCITEPSCSLESILAFRKDYMYKDMDGDTMLEEECRQEDYLVEKITSNVPDNNSDKNPDKKENMKMKGILFLLIVCDLIIFFLCFLNVLPFSFIYGGFLLLGLFVAGLFVYELSDSKEDNPDNIMEAYFQAQQQESILTQEASVVYGETSVLSQLNDSCMEVVVEDESKELYLLPLKKDEYPSIYVKKDSAVIGCMKESCDYVLQERGISRLHAKIMKTSMGLILLDLNSTNGTFLNGEQMIPGQDYSLEKGDMIAFSQVEFVVTDGSIL